ncbi:collagen alpha-1(I) chain-like [Monodelphis domestica]|uniref:collagen alpha-1(I) chain-like n=1 Tax=Monodelphis domestica TaxID=13616 RepID=UPI0024E1FB41|nr:collagen alpha-1(I) chain-like [Monodelphis domestica]
MACKDATCSAMQASRTAQGSPGGKGSPLPPPQQEHLSPRPFFALFPPWNNARNPGMLLYDRTWPAGLGRARARPGNWANRNGEEAFPKGSSSEGGRRAGRRDGREPKAEEPPLAREQPLHSSWQKGPAGDSANVGRRGLGNYSSLRAPSGRQERQAERTPGPSAGFPPAALPGDGWRTIADARSGRFEAQVSLPWGPGPPLCQGGPAEHPSGTFSAGWREGSSGSPLPSFAALGKEGGHESGGGLGRGCFSAAPLPAASRSRVPLRDQKPAGLAPGTETDSEAAGLLPRPPLSWPPNGSRQPLFIAALPPRPQGCETSRDSAGGPSRAEPSRARAGSSAAQRSGEPPPSRQGRQLESTGEQPNPTQPGTGERPSAAQPGTGEQPSPVPEDIAQESSGGQRSPVQPQRTARSNPGGEHTQAGLDSEVSPAEPAGPAERSRAERSRAQTAQRRAAGTTGVGREHHASLLPREPSGAVQSLSPAALGPLLFLRAEMR